MRQAFLILLLAAAALRGQTVPAKDRLVIVMSIDGFSAYQLADPSLPVPNLRKLMANGTSAERMIPVDPTVTWPNHTSMVTGVPPSVHEVLYNGLPVRGGPGQPVRVEPWRDKSELVRAPTVYDLAHKAGLTTAEIDWVAISNPGTITWSFAEQPKANDRIPREMVDAGLFSDSEMAGFAKANITWKDWVWTLAARHIVEKHRPNLLLSPAEHRQQSTSIRTSHAGRQLRAGACGCAAWRTAPVRGKSRPARATTVLVVSRLRLQTGEEIDCPQCRALWAEGLLRPAGGGKFAGDVAVIPEGGTAMVYVTNPSEKAALLPKLRALFAGIEGISRVLDSNDFAALGLPLPEKNQRMADLVLAAKDATSSAASSREKPWRFSRSRPAATATLPPIPRCTPSL